VRELRRIGKRIASGVDGGLWLVLHLMMRAGCTGGREGQSCRADRVWQPSIFPTVPRAHRSRRKAPCIVACPDWRGGQGLARLLSTRQCGKTTVQSDYHRARDLDLYRKRVT
jgi:hypothetical protein